MVLHVWCGCGPTRVVWCVLQASKCVVVESLWSYTCRVVVVLHVSCGVCYRPASVAWLSHCGPTRVVWLWSYTCRVVCVTGQQVWCGRVSPHVDEVQGSGEDEQEVCECEAFEAEGNPQVGRRERRRHPQLPRLYPHPDGGRLRQVPRHRRAQRDRPRPLRRLPLEGEGVERA